MCHLLEVEKSEKTVRKDDPFMQIKAKYLEISFRGEFVFKSVVITMERVQPTVSQKQTH